jgi:hypothetical protein
VSWNWSVTLLKGRRQKIYYKSSIKERRCNYFCCEKEKFLHIESLCLALIIQRANSCVVLYILLTVACLALEYCSTLSHKRQIFGKEFLN